MPDLVLDGLTKTYGKTTVVRGVDLAVADGEFVSLLGPSGCGKTTTLRLIAGFVEPSGGRITMDGKLLSDARAVVPPERRGMSMIFQSYAVWPTMTVAENVAFGLSLRRLPKAEITERVTKILDIVHLAPLADRYPAELSGGQQQRVALARSIVVRPKVLLLDEPLSNLDAGLREEMRFEIRRLHDEFRITTVCVTHDQAEAMVTSDRIAVMHDGRIEQIDAPYRLYTRPQTRFVAGFIGRTNLVPGKRHGGTLQIGGLSFPAAAVPDLGDGPDVLFSLRPQVLRLSLTRPADSAGSAALSGRLISRVFLGEQWDYVFAPDESPLRLRTSAPASDVFPIDVPLWTQFAFDNLVAIS